MRSSAGTQWRVRSAIGSGRRSVPFSKHCTHGSSWRQIAAQHRAVGGFGSQRPVVHGPARPGLAGNFATYRSNEDDSDDDELSEDSDSSHGTKVENQTNTSLIVHAPPVASGGGPPSPWKQSSAKKNIITHLKDKNSDIHLFIGDYTPGNYKKVNFTQLHQKFAPSYKANRFRENFKTLLKNKYNKTGDFKDKNNGIDPWTSRTGRSKGWHLLHNLLMDSATRPNVVEMPAEQLWGTSIHFKCYQLKDFKKYKKDMELLTTKLRKQIADEEAAFLSDKRKYPASKRTDRGELFWYNHPAKDLLREDVKSGRAFELTPAALRDTRKEYQDFLPKTFCKHVHQEKEKQRASEYWRLKRNIVAQKQHQKEQEEHRNKWISQQMVDEMADGLDVLKI